METGIQHGPSSLGARYAALLQRCSSMREEAGSALIELALVVSFLMVPALLGVVQVGSTVYNSIEVSNAAHAGAMYGMLGSSYASNTSGITTAAQGEAADFGTSLSVTPTYYWACSEAMTGTTYSTAAAATTGCTGTNNHGIEFVKVTTSVTVTPKIHLPGLSGGYTLQAVSIMEVKAC